MAGQVEGIACGPNEKTIPDLGMARQQMKLEGAKLKATVVTAILCQEERWEFNDDDCYRVVRCMGDAGHVP
jgi:hypothetical protein